jgi:hypothetical protein
MTIGHGRGGHQFQQATVWIEGPGVSVRLYAEGVFHSVDAFEIAGAGWEPATGVIRLCVAVQRQETTWHGVGRVSTQRSHYQFAAVMTLAMSGPHACLSGPGTLRKTGETVRLRIEAC